MRIMTLLLYAVFLSLTYGWFINNPFIMDDEIHIVENRHIHDLSHWPSYFTSSSMDSGGAEKMQGIYYKPLLMTHFAVIWNFFGADPAAYRLPNYILHTINAFLIFNFSTLFLSLGLSFILGALFLLHPINAEVVLYICNMQDILYLFFGMSSLLLASQIKSKASLFFALSVTFWLGLLSKETAALFLFITAFYVWQQKRTHIKVTLLAAAWVGLAYLALRYSIDLVSTESHHLLFHQASFLERLQTLPLIWAHYIELLFVPWRLSLTADFVVQTFSFTEFWLPIFICAAFLFLIYRLKIYFDKTQFRDWYYFFIFVLICWFGLHSHILVPLDGVYTDRWLYMAGWVFVSVLVMGLSTLFESKKVVLALLGLLALYSVRDYVRGLDWSSPLRLYSRELELHPNDAIMSNNVGVILFRQGDWQKTKPYFIQATEANPSWNVAWNNLGAIEEREGNFARALELYKKSFEAGSYALAVENYAKLVCRLDRIQECREHVKFGLDNFPYNSILNEIQSQLDKIKQ
jgi:hypothetical protein